MNSSQLPFCIAVHRPKISKNPKPCRSLNFFHYPNITPTNPNITSTYPQYNLSNRLRTSARFFILEPCLCFARDLTLYLPGGGPLYLPIPGRSDRIQTTQSTIPSHSDAEMKSDTKTSYSDHSVFYLLIQQFFARVCHAFSAADLCQNSRRPFAH